VPCSALNKNSVHGRLERRGGARRVGGADAAAGRPGPTTGPSGQVFVVYRLVQRHRWRKVAPDTRHPKADPQVQSEWKKKNAARNLAAVLTPAAVQDRPIRLMFQDEARFGRMARIRRCWAPAPLRPTVRNGYEREFTYVYGAVSPRKANWTGA